MTSLTKKLLIAGIYLLLIVLINAIFAYTPDALFLGQKLNAAELVGGVIYVVRDYAQRECQHYVLVLMLVGVLITYKLVSPELAYASIFAFLAGESVDWAIYSWMPADITRRIVVSSCCSSFIDSAVFLLLLNQLQWLPWLVMSFGKLMGVALIMHLWRVRAQKNIPVVS